jgi:hypothetical protein
MSMNEMGSPIKKQYYVARQGPGLVELEGHHLDCGRTQDLTRQAIVRPVLELVDLTYPPTQRRLRVSEKVVYDEYLTSPLNFSSVIL